jgi:hypothetical protein
MALYFEVPRRFVKHMLAGDSRRDVDDDDGDALATPSERLLARWLRGSDEYRNERLKLIPLVAEGPWVVRNAVTGRPAIIGKKLPVTYRLHRPGTPATAPSPPAWHIQNPVLVATLDVGGGSAAAKRIVGVCRRYMSALTVDIGLVIQGEAPDELPEQMLGSIRVHAADPLQAPSLLHPPA